MTRFVLAAVFAIVVPLASASAAVPELVGKLALAVDRADEIGLSDSTRERLEQLISARTDEGLELLLEVKDLPASEQDEKLAPYRAQTERLGRQLLTAEQWQKVEQLAVADAGLAAITEPQVAEALKLSDEQKQQAEAILTEFRSQVGPADSRTREQLRTETDRRLRGLLSDEQYAGWQQLAGESPDADAPQTAQAQPTPGQPPRFGSGTLPSRPGFGGRPPQTAEVEEPMSTVAGQSAPASDSMGARVVQDDPNVAPRLPQISGNEPSQDAQLRFNFRFQPWSEVLDWFARQADLSLVMDAPPPGTFNYSDTRTYTPAEAIDLLNSVLLTKGYTLVRRERMLLVVNLADGIPPNLVPYVALEDLDKRGEFELIKVLFPLSKLTPAEGQAEIQPLLGPQGAVVPLERARQLLVTETAGRLRTIRSVIDSIERPALSGDLEVIPLANAMGDEVMALIRQLFDIPSDRSGLEDGTLTVAIDPLGTRLLVSGRPDRVARVKQIVEITDQPSATAASSGNPLETPQLEVYTISSADPDSVLAVMQTLLAGEIDVRLAIDPKTGNLVALARPSQHATIRATLEQMQRDARQVEVIRLRFVEPSVALLAVQGLFGLTTETPDPRAPKVEVDPTSRQLLVRGTEAQVTQIRTLLEKMGETGMDEDSPYYADRGNVRLIPTPATGADALLQQVEQLWPTVRPNRLRIVRPAADGEPEERGGPLRIRTDMPFQPQVPWSTEQPAAPQQQPQPQSQGDGPQASLPAKPRGVFRQAALQQDATTQQGSEAAAAEDAESDEEIDSTITIIPGPNGLIISSDDLEALDEFEALFATLSSQSSTSGRVFSVFYLKSANAQVVAETLSQLLGASTGATTTDTGGGGLLGGVAEAALGDVGGGLFGSLLGLGGGDSFLGTSSLSIIPDLRLNALIVQGPPADVDAIEQLLRVLDEENPPETAVASKARLIAVENQPATGIANTLRQVYADRLVSTGGQQRQPSPEEFIALLRGGGRGGRGGRGGGGSDDPRTKMSIGVDERTNSLVIVAPDDLFAEVEQLVETLDSAPTGRDEVMEVVSLKRSNASAVQQALVAIVGPQVTTTTTPPAPQPTSRDDRSGGQADQFRQRVDFFNNLRQSLEGQRGGRPTGGGAPTSRGGGSRGR
jgi:type II secretory pathway component GspD/PulD (secretin)